MKTISTKLTETLQIPFPVIMAPMFLVSNLPMIEAAMKTGIAGAFPTLNYRKENELETVLEALNNSKKNCSGTYGVNLIVPHQHNISHPT